MKSATSKTWKRITEDFSMPSNETSEASVPIPEPSKQSQEIFEETSLSSVPVMHHSKQNSTLIQTCVSGDTCCQLGAKVEGTRATTAYYKTNYMVLMYLAVK